MSEQRQRMIQALNSAIVIEWSASCGELEYVLAENNEGNRRILLDAGFTEEQLAEATDPFGEEIDLTHLAFNYAGIYCWYKDKGFIEEDELNEIMAREGVEQT